MITKQTFNGFWNLPNTNNSTAGLLTFDPFSISELELLGHLQDGNEFNVLLKEEIIHGFTSNGKKISLLKSSHNGNSMSFPGIPTISYKPTYIVVGEHLYESNASFYNEIEVEIELLTKWVDIWGFTYKERQNKYINLEYELPDDVQFEINDRVKGCFTFSGKSVRNYEEEFISTHKAKLQINSQDDLTLGEILEYAWHFNKFLTIATESNTYFKSIFLKSPYITDSNGEEKWPRNWNFYIISGN